MHVCAAPACREAHSPSCTYRERDSDLPPPPQPEGATEPPWKARREEPSDEVTDLVNDMLGPYIEAGNAADKAALPPGVPFAERAPLVREAIRHMLAHSGSFGSRATLIDNVAAHVQATLRFAEECERLRAASKATGKAISHHCLTCNGPCEWTQHHRKCRIKAARDMRHFDLEELHRDDVIDECIRLRGLVSTRDAYPNAPAWVHSVKAFLPDYYLSPGGKAGHWAWRSPFGTRELSRWSHSPEWSVAILHRDGSASAAETTDLAEAARLLGA